MPDATRRVFISYARADSTAFVDRLEKDLKAQQFHPWVDRHGLEGGQQWLNTIQQAIDESQALVVVLSPAAVQSEYVHMEYHYAREEGKPVIPVMWRAVKIPMDLRLTQCLDFQTSYEEGLRQLMQALSHLKAPAGPPAESPQVELVYRPPATYAPMPQQDTPPAEPSPVELVYRPPATYAPAPPPAQDKPPQPQAAPPKSEQPHQQRAPEALNPVVESIPIQGPTTRPGWKTWWVVAACPKDGDVENLNTWRVVYASWDDTSTWEQIRPEAQPYCEGAKAARGFTRHKLTKSHRALSRSLARYFDALHWETPFAVDWLKEFEDHGWASPRGDL